MVDLQLTRTLGGVLPARTISMTCKQQQPHVNIAALLYYKYGPCSASWVCKGQVLVGTTAAHQARLHAGNHTMDQHSNFHPTRQERQKYACLHAQPYTQGKHAQPPLTSVKAWE